MPSGGLMSRRRNASRNDFSLNDPEEKALERVSLEGLSLGFIPSWMRAGGNQAGPSVAPGATGRGVPSSRRLSLPPVT